MRILLCVLFALAATAGAAAADQHLPKEALELIEEADNAPATSRGATDEWVRPWNAGGWVDGALLYSGKDEALLYGQLICITPDGDFMVKRKDGEYRIFDVAAPFVGLVWQRSDDKAFRSRQATTCSSEHMLRAIGSL